MKSFSMQWQRRFEWSRRREDEALVKQGGQGKGQLAVVAAGDKVDFHGPFIVG